MLRNHLIYTTYCDWRLNIKKAEGSHLWTDDGKQLIDFATGWNVANLGWNHPEVMEAVLGVTKEKTYGSLWMGNATRDQYAKALTDALPGELSAVGPATGGTEANEEALKSARAFTRRKKLIGLAPAYHGQSFGSMAIGTPPEYVSDIGPLVPDFVQLDYPDTYRSKQSPEELLESFVEKLEEVLKKEDVAAMITETGVVTGEGNMALAPPGYLTRVRELTKKYGTLLIVDEVGTGFSRTGKLFGVEHENVEPDIMTFAKGQSNGAAPLGAMVARTDIAERIYDKANITSTYGWLPGPCAAGLKTLEVHQRDKVWEQAAENGEYLVKSLREQLADHPLVDDVRGVGMLVGIDIVKDKQDKETHAEAGASVREEALKRGLHVPPGMTGTIQLMPPLTIERDVLDEGIEILVDVIKEAK
ncbi:MAG TPA: aspartate aminotransferase family protein [Patescibacteria group bacterium]|jgi:4-aminobutyrate aminotransferase-like enzyme